MSRQHDRYQKRRLRSSYFSVIVSIGLVLFLVGLLGIVVFKTKDVTDHVKENVALTVFLKDDTAQSQIKLFESKLKTSDYAKKVVFIDKNEAAKQFQDDIGEDFVNFIGENPLKNAFDVYLKANYVTPEKIEEIEKEIKRQKFVYEVSYDKPLITILTKNINRLSIWILGFSVFFTFVAIILINGSIRLSVYSKRFTIKTMQMVGATKSFIRKPFIYTSIKLGIVGALFAILGLGGIIYYGDIQFPQFSMLENLEFLIFLFSGILVLGIIITWISTYFATQRFLNLRINELYY
ncbi:cell division protein FtsX [Aureivirga sp. CE67]|uniref:cell division protein FtsX n=1 Tax=Aureivirga sp. CE67 TaxID=1788983 RepID=UPI0018CAC1D2|nr:permease-like cell division protein FtsX [Aureivirga sp. CE67]